VQIEQCTHEEADTRLILHLPDPAHADHEKRMITTCNTDVVGIILFKLANILMTHKVCISFSVDGGIIGTLQYILLQLICAI